MSWPIFLALAIGILMVLLFLGVRVFVGRVAKVVEI